MGGVLAYPKLGVILAYWKQTGVSSPENPTGENQLCPFTGGSVNVESSGIGQIIGKRELTFFI